MSYILDALRRADAERERDPARGIHAQPAAGLPVRAGRSAPRWTWSVGGAVLAAAGAAAWWMTQQPAPVTAPVRIALVDPQPAAPLVAAPVVVPVSAAVSPPPPPARPVLVTAAVVAKPAPVTVAPAAPAAVAVAPVAAAAPAATPLVADRILAVGELPADVQRELPKLAISGGVHSENAAQRLLIVGGQVVNEGTEVAPGVTLEQVRARSAVLKFRGFRYSVPF